MSWLRNSPLSSSFNTKRSADALPKDCDPEACIETFKKHWQQAHEIIENTIPPKCYPIHDDVLGVVNHVGQMATLLVVELENSKAPPQSASFTPCLEHLLSESILHRLFEWSQHTGRFVLMVKQEQMKLYEKLVSRAGQSLLVHEPFVRPLLRLLTSCCNDTVPLEQEKQLVTLLRQLCISLTQNIQLLDLFFNAKTEHAPSNFILFSLLIPFVHRPGPIGQQARDALLLCMSMSKHHDALGAFIADSSHVCPMLATILSGLYSETPRKLEVDCEDWHRLTTDDVNELDNLTLFVNTLECCNAIVREAHESVSNQLVDFIRNGFLINVMASALLQDTQNSWAHSEATTKLQLLGDRLRVSTEEELVTATAYYELFVRITTAPGLRPSLCHFLMQGSYEEKNILSTLLQRIRPDSSPKLRVVTLALFETLVGLDCEDVMFDLALKYLIPCSHVMFSQRARLRDSDAFTPSALKLLSLSPLVCQQMSPSGPASLPVIQGNPVYGLRPEESLYCNYHAYLCDARSKLEDCVKGCDNWRFPYDGEMPPADEELVPSLGGDSSGYESLVVKSSPGTDGDSPPRLAKDKTVGDRVEENGVDHPVKQNGQLDEELNRRLSGPRTSLSIPESSGELGPFLDSIIGLVENLHSLSLPEILRVTGIISRLAVYPQPLLTSLLLNHSLVFQPSIRSFFQALRSLKQSLDSSISKASGIDEIMNRARQFLLHREERLASIRKTAVETPVQRRSYEPFTRGDSKRRSLSSALSSVFRINKATPEQIFENDSPGSGYKYIRGRTGSDLDASVWNRAICAIIMDEWLKELAAIAQEQMIYAVSSSH